MNIMFTALPILWFALSDFQYSKEEFMRNPKLFGIGLRNECFSTAIFWRWVLYASAQAFLIFFVCIVLNEGIHIYSNGTTAGLWLSGHNAYATVVIVANLKLLHS